MVSWDRTLIGRAGYYIRIEVNPSNADEVLIANSSFHRSTDGGLTFPHDDRGCGDCHDIWMDPKNPDHWVTTGDGGMGITTDHAKTFTRVALPIGQMYHVAVDERVPYWIYSNRQDDGTMRGRSDSPVPVPNVPSYAPPRPSGGFFGFGGRPRGVDWDLGLGGCESGFTHSRPAQPRHRLGVVLRQRDHAVRRARGRGAVGQPVDPHARLGAEQDEVPLPLDAADGAWIRSMPRRCTTAAR